MSAGGWCNLFVLDYVSKLEALDRDGKIHDGRIESNNKDERGLFDSLERDLHSLAGSLAEDFARCMSTDTADGESTFRNLEAKIDKSGPTFFMPV